MLELLFADPINYPFLFFFVVVGLVAFVYWTRRAIGEWVGLENSEPDTRTPGGQIVEIVGMTGIGVWLFFGSALGSYLLVGFAIQAIAFTVSGSLISGWLVVGPSLLASFFVTRLFLWWASKIDLEI